MQYINTTTTGSAVVVPGRGFLLNNELTDFEARGADPDTGVPYANGPEGGKRRRRSAVAGPAEARGGHHHGHDAWSWGGKRPRSSMSPTLVFNASAGRDTTPGGVRAASCRARHSH